MADNPVLSRREAEEILRRQHGQIRAVASGGSGPELVTPAKAEAMLKGNRGNRRLRPTWIKYLARQILAGHWLLTTDGIGITPDGRLINGQHRLLAIIEAGMAAPLLVVRGVSEEAFKVTDRGKMRTLRDVLQISQGLIADANLAALVLGRQRLSETEVADVAAWWSPAFEALEGACAQHVAGFSSATFRVGVGVRWAVERDPADRQQVLQQYAAIIRNDTALMSPASAALWKRWLRDKPGNGGQWRRMTNAIIPYYYIDPRRSGGAPLIRQPDTLLEEFRAVLDQMEQMFLAAGKAAAHPYAPYTPQAEMVVVPRQPVATGIEAAVG